MAIAPLLRKLTVTLVWAACAASVVAWGLRLSGRTLPVPANAQLLAPDQSLRGDPLRLFSQPPAAEQAAAPAQASRFKLVGVVAPVGVQRAGAIGAKGAAAGVALLSMDGKPARAYRVGADLDGGWVLQGVGQRSASLGPAGAAPAVQLEIPALPTPATGTLRPADPSGGTGVAPLASQPGQSALPGVPNQPAPAPVAAVEAPADALRVEGAGNELPSGRRKPGFNR
jgi:general secretion pathway protein C